MPFGIVEPKKEKAMTHIFRNIMAAAAVAVALGACTIETSGNGDLDGFWHLVRVDTIATGGVKDLSAERIFWSIQGPLLDVRDADGRYQECISHFERQGDSLFIKEFYINDREGGDIIVDSQMQLAPFGINSLKEHFYIMDLSGSHLALESATLHLSFEKM